MSSMSADSGPGSQASGIAARFGSDALPSHDLSLERRREGLTRADRLRYGRHLVLPEVGQEGQERLKNSRALVVGAGGLGSPAALYLAAAGVGRLGLVDSDVVDESNLQRQILHGVADVGRLKTASGRDRLAELNPLTTVDAYPVRLSGSNVLDLVGDYDVVVDGSDNFPTRYLLNDACVLLKKPYVYGSVQRFEGQAGVFGLPGGPCYRCFFSEPPAPDSAPACGEAGVLGALPGIIGCIQAAEAIKLLLGRGENSLSGRLLLLDAWTMKFRELALRRASDCQACGDHPSIGEAAGRLTSYGFDDEEEQEPVPRITAPELRELLAREPDLQIIDLREPGERAWISLPNCVSMPYGELAERWTELDPRRTAVAVCRIGAQSETAARSLRKAGYAGRVLNLRGGANAWALETASR